MKTYRYNAVNTHPCNESINVMGEHDLTHNNPHSTSRGPDRVSHPLQTELKVNFTSVKTLCKSTNERKLPLR